MLLPLLLLSTLCLSFILLGAVVAAHAAPEQTVITDRNGPTYQFKYHIHDLMTMDYKTHEEIGENGQVRGTYTVQEPNGNLRVVSYTAGDDRGFQAMVRVRPTVTFEAEPSDNQQPLGHLNPTNDLSVDTDTPLKIELNTGRRQDPDRYREQRKSKTEEKTSETSQHSILPITPESHKPRSTEKKYISDNRLVVQSQKTAFKRQLQGLESKNGSSTRAEELDSGESKRQNFAFLKTNQTRELKTQPTKEKSTKQDIPPPTTKGKYHKSPLRERKSSHYVATEMASAYLPYHLDSAQNAPHHGPIFAPLFLHIVPTRHVRGSTQNLEAASAENNSAPLHCSTEKEPREVPAD